MPTQSRKQREIAERERLVLEVARSIMVERGYLGLTMDRIAAATEYSKGTIYQHFPNKEEIVAALATESAARRVALFEKAATFQGRPRERLAAVGLAANLFTALYPLHYRCENIVSAHSIREKASDGRLQKLEDSEFSCMNVVLGIIRDGVSQGDLAYEDPQTPQKMLLGLWSMSVGFSHMAAPDGAHLQSKLGLDDLQAALFQAYDRFLDGFDWKPLAGDWDYPASLERIRTEVFAQELERLARTS